MKKKNPRGASLTASRQTLNQIWNLEQSWCAKKQEMGKKRTILRWMRIDYGVEVLPPPLRPKEMGKREQFYGWMGIDDGVEVLPPPLRPICTDNWGKRIWGNEVGGGKSNLQVYWTTYEMN